MTISNENNSASLTGNGITSFPFTLKCFSEADLQITHIDVDAVDSAMVLDTDYTITLNADQDSSPGGTVTFPIGGSAFTTIVTGEILLAEYNLDYTQGNAISNNGFYPNDVEQGDDRATILLKQLKRVVDRCLKIPSTSLADVDMEVAKADVLAGYVFRINAAGDGVEAVPSSSIASAGESVVVSNVVGTTRTVLATESNTLFACNNASDVDIVFPAGASVGFVGYAVNAGAGGNTFDPGTDTIIGSFTSSVTKKLVAFAKVGATTWVLGGDVA